MFKIHETGPEPESREEHNRLINEAVIRYQTPRTFICPDCMLPTKLCHHLRDSDLQPLLAPPPKRSKP